MRDFHKIVCRALIVLDRLVGLYVGYPAMIQDEEYVVYADHEPPV